MKAFEIPIFFALYAIGNIPEPWRIKSLAGRLILNLGSKILLAWFFCLSSPAPFGCTLVALNGAMVLAVAAAVHVDSYSRFFERTDLAQSVFLVDLCAIGMPMEEPVKFLVGAFIPHLTANAILLSVGFLRELQTGRKTIHVEDFYNFFGENKIAATAMFAAMAFSMGTPPLGGDIWRLEFATAVFRTGRGGLFAASVLCFYAIGYVYLKWSLPVFSKKRPANVQSTTAHAPPTVDRAVFR
jgi:hypothetical protein